MFAINELNKRKSHVWGLTRGIVYKDKNYIEFGYFKLTPDCLKTNYEGRMYYDIRKNLDTIEVFSILEGIVKKFEKGDPEIEEHLNVFGNGYYPYTIEREYEAEKHIEMFKDDDSLNLSEDKLYSFADELKYSFGIEFETAAGYLPQSKCFELGLIPLRDGSISGVEYSTIPMSDNEGICLLKRQLEALKKYTYTNKECSVHIHMGGYPVNPKAIFILHSMWYYVQHYLSSYIPNYSYRTDAFKKNGKNYCGTVEYFDNFKNLYQYYVGQKYLGDLYQPHPNDIEKRAKWNIKTRYFNCNFINMLCYKGAKTVEFRFLTPTYSFEKITTFLLIFNGILRYAESLYDKWKNLSDNEILNNLGAMDNSNKLYISHILKEVYNEDTFEMLKTNLKKLDWLRNTQNHVGDYCGSRLDIENRYFPDGKQES